jgi:hypothetical protein
MGGEEVGEDEEGSNMTFRQCQILPKHTLLAKLLNNYFMHTVLANMMNRTFCTWN